MQSCQNGRPGPNGQQAFKGRAEKPGLNMGSKNRARARPYTGSRANGPALAHNFFSSFSILLSTEHIEQHKYTGLTGQPWPYMFFFLPIL